MLRLEGQKLTVGHPVLTRSNFLSKKCLRKIKHAEKSEWKFMNTVSWLGKAGI